MPLECVEPPASPDPRRVKPTKIIAHRQRSATATCTRMVPAETGPFLYRCCGEPLVMFFTPSPLSTLPYETLFMLRCPEHVFRADGVLPENTVADNPWLDCGGTF